MKRILLSGVVSIASIVATNALAEPWQGVWAADPAWCSNVDRIGTSENAPIRITASKIDGLENTCEITNVTPLGVGSSWRVDQSCWGEGVNYRLSELLLVDYQGRLVKFDDQDFSITFSRCQ